MLPYILSTLLFSAIVTPSYSQTLLKNKNQTRIFPKKDYKFINYISRFDPVNVIDSLYSEQKVTRRSYDTDEFFNKAFDRIDPTPELLKLKIQNGNVKVLTGTDGRRNWLPPSGISAHRNDAFSLRPRLYELMKQALYQARNKMVIMQMKRDKYRNHSVYKMGFLTAKTDSTVKTFAQVAHRSFRVCGQKEQDAIERISLFDMLTAQDRLLHLWNQVDLLKDLMRRNDDAARKVLQRYTVNKAHKWRFID